MPTRRAAGSPRSQRQKHYDTAIRGLRHLQARLGTDFVVGIVLYIGRATLPFGEGLRAVPVSALWQLQGT